MLHVPAYNNTSANNVQAYSYSRIYLQGLPEHWTRKELVQRAMDGDPILDVSPEDAALRGHFAEQVQ